MSRAPVIPLPVIYAPCCGGSMRVVTECATCHEDRCALCIDDHECDDGAHGECACPECVERAIANAGDPSFGDEA